MAHQVNGLGSWACRVAALLVRSHPPFFGFLFPKKGHVCFFFTITPRNHFSFGWPKLLNKFSRRIKLGKKLVTRSSRVYSVETSSTALPDSF